MKLGNTIADTFSDTSSQCIAYSISRLRISFCIKLYSVRASIIIMLSITRHYIREHNIVISYTNKNVVHSQNDTSFLLLHSVIILQALNYIVRCSKHYRIKPRPIVFTFLIIVVLLIIQQENNMAEYSIT
jgi:hypothetical protein